MRLLFILFVFSLCGCKDQPATAEFYHPILAPAHPVDTLDFYSGDDSLVHFHGYGNCYVRFHADTVFIHDTLYRNKITHINSAKSVIIGGDSNSPINQ